MSQHQSVSVAQDLRCGSASNVGTANQLHPYGAEEMSQHVPRLIVPTEVLPGHYESDREYGTGRESSHSFHGRQHLHRSAAPFESRGTRHAHRISGSRSHSVPPSGTRRPILFYHKEDPHYGFTNFSPHEVEYRKRTYPTSEHLFQSFKFLDRQPRLAEHIRTYSKKPSVALSEARRFQPEVRRDWMDINIKMMDFVLSLKFKQHPELVDELLATRDAELIEASDKDSFWGWGPDRRGRNELGKALERLRERLQNPRRRRRVG